MLVTFKEDIPATFIDENLEARGPFKSGEEADLPDASAELFLKLDKAKLKLNPCIVCINWTKGRCAKHPDHYVRSKRENGLQCPDFKGIDEDVEKGGEISADLIPEEFRRLTISGLRALMRKWLHIIDPEAIDVVISTRHSIGLSGDPLWLLLIGPPGGEKTELLRSLSGSRVYSLSSLTPHTLISGLKRKNRGDLDLLPSLDAKLLVIKDFTTILSDERNLNEILSQLRECYDGYLEKSFGSGAGTIGYHSTFGLIAAATPVIDRYWSVNSLLGDRFLKLRIKSERSKAAEKAAKVAGQEREMRAVLRIAVLAFTSRLEQAATPGLSEELERRLTKLAEFIALFRSQVFRDRMHRVEVVPEPEVATRLAKQLKKLALALATVRGKREADEGEYRTLQRVSIDSVPEKRMKIALALPDLMEVKGEDEYETEEGPRSSEVGQKVRLPTTTTTEELEDMWALGICERAGDEDTGYRWRLRGEVVELMEECGILPPKRHEPRHP